MLSVQFCHIVHHVIWTIYSSCMMAFLHMCWNMGISHTSTNRTSISLLQKYCKISWYGSKPILPTASINHHSAQCHSTGKAFVQFLLQFSSNVGWWGLIHGRCSSSHERFWIWVTLRLCAGHNKRVKHLFMHSALCMGEVSLWSRTRFSPIHNVGSWNIDGIL